PDPNFTLESEPDPVRVRHLGKTSEQLLRIYKGVNLFTKQKSYIKGKARKIENGPVVDSCARLLPGGAKHEKGPSRNSQDSGDRSPPLSALLAPHEFEYQGTRGATIKHTD
ncbi:hypothetical protein Prudu_016585, partial [Prunus dulcis]